MHALIDPDLESQVALAGDFPDHEQKQLCDDKSGDQGQAAETLGEDAGEAAEIPLPEGQHDPQCRQRHEDKAGRSARRPASDRAA